MDVEIEVEDIWYNDFYINRVFRLKFKVRGDEETFRLGNSKESWTVKLDKSSENFYFSKLDCAVRFIIRELGDSNTVNFTSKVVEKIKSKNRKLESKIQNMIWSSEFSELVSSK